MHRKLRPPTKRCASLVDAIQAAGSIMSKQDRADELGDIALAEELVFSPSEALYAVTCAVLAET